MNCRCTPIRFYSALTAGLLAMMGIGVLRAEAQPAADLAAHLSAARTTVRPVTKADVRKSMDRVRRTLSQIERVIGGNSVRGQGWKKYLLWNRQQDQFSGKIEADAVFWRRVYRLLTRTSKGFELKAFQDYRRAVDQLVMTLEAASHPSLQAECQATVSQVSQLLLDGRRTELSVVQAAQLSELLTKLARRQQARELIEATHRKYAHPNLLIYLPKDLVVGQLTGKIDEPFDYADSIGGALITGSGRLRGGYDVTLRDDSNQASLRVAIAGTSQSNTTGTSEGVAVRTRGNLKYQSVGRVTIDMRGIEIHPFQTSGSLRTQILGITTPYSGKRDATARQEVLSRQEDDRLIAERRAINSLSRSLRQKVTGHVAEIDRAYRTNIYRFLLCHDLLPEDSTFRTDRQGFHAAVQLSLRSQIGAHNRLSKFNSGTLGRIAVHQSAVGRLSQSLAGKTTTLRIALTSLAGGNVASPANDADVTITYSSPEAVRANFEDNRVTIQLLTDHLYRQKQAYSGMEITIPYRLDPSGKTPRLIPDGAPLIVPALRADGTRPRGGIRSLAVKRVLMNILKRDLPASIELADSGLLKSWQPLGDVKIVNVAIRDGWIVVNFKLRDK